ncbi:hypothetical protein F4805DRAFT_415867 [Annulohypoxylon moriforme]|nr:hypothetical protein F4805DRAFT_415867 [Annulohypoxylon moriforme]
MDAYASVDMPTRRKMDEMLRTWKEPVPGSLDTRPVFPLDVTRPIENALIKARTTALQTQREYARGQQQLFGRGRPMNQGMPYRDTPTPPGVQLPPQVNGYPTHSPVPTTNGSSYPHPAQSSAGYPSHLSQPPPSRSTPQPMPATLAFQPPQLGGYGVPKAVISIDALNDDVQRLILASKAQIAQAPHDPSLQRRLKALVDLQTVLQTQNLPEDQLVLVKNQIADLAVTIRAPPAQTTTPTPVPQPVAVAPPPAAAPKISIDSLFGPGALAALMARKSTTPQASTPYPPPPAVPVPTPPPQRVEPQKPVATHPPPPPVPNDPMALMNMLRLAGMLPGAPAAGSSAAASHPTPPVPFPAPLSIPRMPPVNQPVGPVTLESLTSDIVLRPSSLKQFRPQLLPFLFGSLGPQCTQCGRRFPKDEEGKKKKTAHMDWHFRVNQRIAEVEKRGQHRSWLVDEMDWIKTRETIDKDHVAPPADSNAAAGGSAPKVPKLQYIPVPDDPSLANSVCSICQEKFETRWLDDAQEFVWPDAMKVGEKIYHASCYQEAFKGSANNGGNTPSYARGTPEPVTGKRKAEQDELSSATRSKVKVEGT